MTTDDSLWRQTSSKLKVGKLLAAVEKVAWFPIVCSAVLIPLLLTGCIATSWEYHHGISRYEGFMKPTRVLVSRADGSIAIEVESFTYSPSEAAEYFDGDSSGPPFAERIPGRLTRRRFLYASAEEFGELGEHQSGSASCNTGVPADLLKVSIYLRPLQVKNERKGTYPEWNIIPVDFDAPSATERDLPASFAGGYDEYPWQESEGFEAANRGLGYSEYYYAWKNPVPWKSADGRKWRLSFHLYAYPDAARHERPHIFLDWFRPAFWAVDIVTSPVQVVAIPLIFALNL